MCQELFAQESIYKAQTIAFYNLENLFDTANDPSINDEAYTPEGSNHWDNEKYQNKLKNMSEVLVKIGTSNVFQAPPAVIGVCEIENRKVLEDLIAMPALSLFDYQIVQFDSPDERGIDTALIYRADAFSVESAQPYRVNLPDSTDRTRDILLVNGFLEGKPMHFLVNHWPSRSGGERRSMPNRRAAATVARHIVDSLNQVDAKSKILLMGDFNDDPISPSVDEVLNAKIKKKNLTNNDLYNPFYDFYKKGFGTTAWRDSWSLFDMIIVSNALVEEKRLNQWRFVKAGRFAEDFMVQQEGKYKGYPLRTSSFGNYLNGYSDHFPVFVYLVEELAINN